jgi:hypothetical protein
MFGQVRRGGPGAVAYPQQSTSVTGPSDKRRNFPTLPVFEFGNSQPIRRGCHASADRPSIYPPAEAFPRRRQICCRGPRWGRWAFSGLFALCRPAGRTKDQCSVRFERAWRQVRRDECPRPAGQARPQPGPILPHADEKNYAWRRNHPATPALTSRRRAKPPAPHPQSPGVEPRPF